MASPHGRRLALLVANDNYHVKGMPPLYAPAHDAEQLRELLRDPEIGGFQPAELLINESKSEIERSIERLFRGAEPDDVVLFYFSGHGLRTRQSLYLAASNTDPELLSSTAVSSGLIKELIRDSAASARVILLDCCYSGAFLGADAVKSVLSIDDVGEQVMAAWPRAAGESGPTGKIVPVPRTAFDRPVDFATVLGIDDPWGFDVAAAWHPRPWRDQLTVPIGLAADGEPVVLDLKDPASDGMGPHGLLVGATGSGKSELLRTIVLGLAVTHSPEALNVALVEFKGSATFRGLAELPHAAAVLTNLADDLSQADRMVQALTRELNRRQALLRDANIRSQPDYAHARERDPTLSPLPALLIVIDEFSELLTAKPEAVELLTMIGRAGRSVGMHLLLASQRLDEGRLGSLNTFLSYRIGLRTFSAAESREVLGVPDAYELPSEPGHALTADSRYGLSPAAWPGRGALQVPIGWVDRPYHQRREPLQMDLAGRAGHAAVIGGPGSGKSTLVRTMVAGLALTHTPEELQFYCLDFAGGALAALADLPHVGSVAGRADRDRIRRTLAELASLLAEREQLFAGHQIQSMAAYRQRRRDSGPGDDPYGDVFLVVDGWGTVRTEFDELEAPIMDLAARGLPYGVHLVLTARRWFEVRPALKDLIGTRLELRLSEPSESEIDRRTAANVPVDTPGRGLGPSREHYLAALPRIDGDARASTLEDGLADLCQQVRAAWPGPAAPPVRMLPERLRYESLPASDPAAGVMIGIDEDALGPVYLDFSAEPHFLVFGEPESGKSNLLRVILRQLADRYPPEQARLILIDYRRTLLEQHDLAHTLGYAATPTTATAIIGDVAKAMAQRLPGPEVTTDQLHSRRWWSGPDLYLVVDDYEATAVSAGSPLLPLADFLPMAQDVGLHLVVARAMGGAGRAIFDPVLRRIREMGSTGLLLSGSREEGPLLGNVRPEPMPPGRGRLVTRRDGVRLIQTPYLPPGEAPANQRPSS